MNAVRSRVTFAALVAIFLIAAAAYVSSHWYLTAASPLALNTLCPAAQSQEEIYFISCGGIY